PAGAAGRRRAAPPPPPQSPAVLAPAGPPADQAPSAHPAAPKPAQPARARAWLFAGGAALVVVAIGLAAWLLVGRGAPIAAVAPAGPAMAPRPNVRVLSDTSNIYDITALGDAGLAATPGGPGRFCGGGSRPGF